MGFVDLLIVALIPVIQVLFTTGVGLFMAVDSVNLLGPVASHSLNNGTLAWFLIQVTRTPPHLHGLVIGCCSTGNVGNLLIIVVPAVCQEANSPFGDSSSCSTSAEAYASLSMAVAAIYICSKTRRVESCKESLLPSSMHCAETPGSGSVKRMQVPVIEKILHLINMIAEKVEFKMIFAP
ncbi:hypothetical protein F3Y22_tig00002840pilonHSYRG00672 [Hibiscus syriacus]|uniref:Uncharacterized protein n=1 Tax=Hibiscus syriacus TaxID=106335 RepID=A0A6A3CP98_HIBSY|nr:hypothetical protein F3Y22_tig00002840pilonHSYRG00672 [Hibiscus syriacus]